MIKIPSTMDSSTDLSPRQQYWGLFLSVGYLFIFPVIVYFLMIGLLGEFEGDILIAQVIAGFVTIGSFFILFRPQQRELISLNHPQWIAYLVISIGLLFASNIGWNFVLIQVLGDLVTNANQTALLEATLHTPIWTGLLTVIVAPLVEELIFRYVAFRSLLKSNPLLAWLFAVIGFAMIHLLSSIGTESWWIDVWTLPSYMLASLVLTVLYYRTNRFALVVVTHLIYNAIVYSIMLIEVFL